MDELKYFSSKLVTGIKVKGESISLKGAGIQNRRSMTPPKTEK